MVPSEPLPADHTPSSQGSRGVLEVSHEASPTGRPSLPRVSSVPVTSHAPLPRMGSGMLEVSHKVSPTHAPLPRVASAPVTVSTASTPVSSEVAEVDQPSDEPVVVAMEPGSPTLHTVATDTELNLMQGEEPGHSEPFPAGEGSGQPGEGSGQSGEGSGQFEMGLTEEVDVQTSSLVEESLEETPEVKFTQGPPESDISDYGGSIMLSEDDSVVGAMVLNLPVAPLPDICSSEVPSSPVLPTTSETIISLEQETETPPTSDQLEEDLLSFSSNELPDLEEDQLGGSAILPSNFTESLPDVDTGPEPRQVVEGFELEIEEALGVNLAREPKLSPQPERRPSPYPDGAAGVREALYTAWLPSTRTQEMLANPREAAQHLTCPGLVADVRMVREGGRGYFGCSEL